MVEAVASHQQEVFAVNQNEKEGQSSGRTTGATGNQAEQQQKRTIEGQDSDPGKVWQDSDKGQGQYTGQGTAAQGGSGQSGMSGQGMSGQGTTQGGSSSQGQYTGEGDTRVGGSDPGHGTSGHGTSGQGTYGQGGSGSDAGIRGGFNDTRGSSSEDASDESTDRAGQGWGTSSDEGGSQGNSGSM